MPQSAVSAEASSNLRNTIPEEGEYIRTAAFTDQKTFKDKAQIYTDLGFLGLQAFVNEANRQSGQGRYRTIQQWILPK